MRTEAGEMDKNNLSAETVISQSQPSSAIVSAYNQWSHTYEVVENPTRDLAAHVLRRELPDLHDLNVLEIGCGTGVNTRYLAERGRSVRALDFSPGMLDRARVNVPASNVRFEQQDIRIIWNLADASVDLVVCTLVLEHVENLDHVFKEAKRVLRPGGEFFVCELHPFRQLQGRQAQFTSADTGEVVLVSAYLHDVSDYVNASLQHDFTLLHLGEWRDDESAKSALPRLLSVHVRAGSDKK